SLTSPHCQAPPYSTHHRGSLDIAAIFFAHKALHCRATHTATAGCYMCRLSILARGPRPPLKGPQQRPTAALDQPSL
ncbi:hypothetical protein COCCADRAFT_90362, partial [Bipolaris zeicola 26-R-13]